MSDRDAGGVLPFKISKRTVRNHKISLSALGCRASMRPGMKIRKWAAIAALAFGTIAANDVAPTNAELEAMYDKAFRAFDAANYVQALKELDGIDARKPDLAASQNLRGVIYMRQGLYDKAEAALLEAQRLDPKFWNARFNLAEIPRSEEHTSELQSQFHL